MNDTDNSASKLRAIVAEILVLSPDEIDDTADLFNHYEADSLNLIEIVAQVEKQYQVVLPWTNCRRRAPSPPCTTC